MKADLGISAWKQFTFRVGHIHFREQRPRIHADGVVGSRDSACKLAIGKGSNLHRGPHVGSNGLAVYLRNIYVDPHCADVGDAEKFRSLTAIAGVDQVTYLGVSSCNHYL